MALHAVDDKNTAALPQSVSMKNSNKNVKQKKEALQSYSIRKKNGGIQEKLVCCLVQGWQINSSLQQEKMFKEGMDKIGLYA